MGVDFFGSVLVKFGKEIKFGDDLQLVALTSSDSFIALRYFTATWLSEGIIYVGTADEILRRHTINFEDKEDLTRALFSNYYVNIYWLGQSFFFWEMVWTPAMLSKTRNSTLFNDLLLHNLLNFEQKFFND